MRFKKPQPLTGKTSAPAASGLRSVLAGYPEFCRRAYDQFPKFYEATVGLVSLLNEARSQTLDGELQKTLALMAGTLSNSFGALIALSLNGFGHDAVRISRSMFETAVDAAYLRRNPEELNDFLDYGWLRQYKRLEYLKPHHPDGSLPLRKETIEEINMKYATVRPRFAGRNGKPRRSWSRRNIRERAADVGLEEQYELNYAEASSVIHGDFAGLAAQADRSGTQVDIAPSLAGVGEALRMGHQCVIAVLDSLNKAATLGMDDRIAAACVAFQEIWRADAGNSRVGTPA
jgi:hypothetical protein